MGTQDTKQILLTCSVQVANNLLKMKATFILFVVAAVAHGLPQNFGGGLGGNSFSGGNSLISGRSSQQGARGLGGAGRFGQNLAPTNPKSRFGPRFYGQGLENPFAMPVNPFLANRAQAIIRNLPSALARVDIDGEISITNQFGQEVEVFDRFGREFDL